MNKFKPGDLIKVQLFTDKIALYPNINLNWDDRIIRNSNDFTCTVGEIVIMRYDMYIVWWPQLNGFNVFYPDDLKPVNAHV